ncbi:hypothetical protein GTP91_20600 [Rugamonas sp. FT82W]|uniref:Uncharacterized protein n=1 Tax=Duganella vulcania TaxID=2692166 RepID=A0A845G826_9BURK|nr:hypothetical protein [Duganella vulcania]MYM89565.1 hypothetical protein [Duganella vulcania]
MAGYSVGRHFRWLDENRYQLDYAVKAGGSARRVAVAPPGRHRLRPPLPSKRHDELDVATVFAIGAVEERAVPVDNFGCDKFMQRIFFV